MAILPSMLQPLVVMDRISTLVVINTTLQNRFGTNAGGSLVRQHPSRRGLYDVFDDTRDLPTATTPGTQSVSRERFPVAQIPFTIPRSAEKRTIPLEEVNQNRPLGLPDEIDELGRQYLIDQEKNVKQTYTNLREFQTAAMLRGSYSYTQTGDGFTHGFTGGTITINYQIPAGNKSQLNMTGGGDIIGTTWTNNAAPIVRDCLAVNAAFQELVGLGLRDIYVTSVVWGYVITNTEVQNLAGSANDPVQSFTRNEETEEFTAVLRGAPWVTWHINDNGLNVGGSFTKLIPDTAAVFTTRIDERVLQYWECPEPVVDPVSNAVSNQFGEYYYHRFTDDPVAWDFHSRFNGLPILKIPSAIAFATVDF